MVTDLNGNPVCDRCGFVLDGNGVTTGLVATDISDTGATVGRIYCYARTCAAVATAGMITSPGQGVPPTCTTCGVHLEAWTAAFALICTDLDGDGNPRQMAFCRVNGHREQLLNQGWA